MNRVFGLTIVAALAAGLVSMALALAGGAWAHAALTATDPADGSELAAAPTQVTATFNEPMQAQFAAMTIVGPEGGRYDAGEPTVDGAEISQSVRSGGPAGSYTVNYRATSADGHVVSGSWTYRVLQASPAAAPTSATASAPASATTTAAPEPTGAAGDDTPVWPFVAGAVAVVAAGAVWAVRRSS